MARPLRTRAIIFGVVAALFVGAAVAGLIASGSSRGGSPRKQPGNAQVEFIVRGTAPNGVEITYGDDASNYQARSLPLDVTWKIEKNVLYWVMAQLRGGGHIVCEVIIGNARKGGHAIGGWNTCTAQSPSDPLAGWY